MSILLLLSPTPSPLFFLPCSALSPRRLTPWDQSLSLLAWSEIMKLESRGWGSQSVPDTKMPVGISEGLLEDEAITEEREAER